MELNEVAAGPAGQSWAPDTCTLPTGDRPVRVAEFDRLFAEAVTEVRRLEPGRLRLELAATPQVAGRAAELVARETSCCSFFTFTLTATGGRLRLDVAVSQRHVAVLDALAERAARSVPEGARS